MAPPGPPDAAPHVPNYSANFFDPRLAPFRKNYFKALGGGIVVTLVCMMAFLPIYWGALFSTPEQTHKLNGWIVNQDGTEDGSIGALVQQQFLQLSRTYRQLTWTTRDLQESQLEHEMVQDQAWAIIFIRQGATQALAAAQTSASGRSSYNASNQVQVWLNQARNEQAYGNYIMPAIQMPLQMLASRYAATRAASLAGNTAAVADLLTSAPQLLTNPLIPTYINVRPYDVPVATAITFVGSIYLLVLSFVIVMVGFGTRQPFERKLTTASLIRLRLTVPLTVYFFFSAFFALISYAFQAPFDRQFGSAGFVIYWMLCYVGFCALGLAMEAMITLLGPQFIPYFLLLFIITNVSVALLPLQLQPSVYQYGYAFPFYNVSQAVRCILFRTRNQVGLNFGVLFAWIAVSLCTIPLFVFLTRRGAVRQARQEQHRDEEKSEEPVSPKSSEEERRNGTVDRDENVAPAQHRTDAP